MTEPTIDQEARRLDVRKDQKDLARSFRLTNILVVTAIVLVVVALISMGSWLRH